MDFRDRVVVVTGASSGIGWVTAEAFAARGARVIAVARREENLERLIDACRASSPGSAYLSGDLGVRAFAEHVIDDTLAKYGRIDVLVNNAAISKHKQLWHLSADEAERVMQVNFLSCVWTTFAALPHMLLADAGTIVNVSSFAAELVPPRETMYGASKAALHAFTRGLWNDLARLERARGARDPGSHRHGDLGQGRGAGRLQGQEGAAPDRRPRRSSRRSRSGATRSPSPGAGST